MNISDEEYEELESYFQLKLRDKEEQLRFALQMRCEAEEKAFFAVSKVDEIRGNCKLEIEKWREKAERAFMITDDIDHAKWKEALIKFDLVDIDIDDDDTTTNNKKKGSNATNLNLNSKESLAEFRFEFQSNVLLLKKTKEEYLRMEKTLSAMEQENRKLFLKLKDTNALLKSVREEDLSDATKRNEALRRENLTVSQELANASASLSETKAEMMKWKRTAEMLMKEEEIVKADIFDDENEEGNGITFGGKQLRMRKMELSLEKALVAKEELEKKVKRLESEVRKEKEEKERALRKEEIASAALAACSVPFSPSSSSSKTTKTTQTSAEAKHVVKLSAASHIAELEKKIEQLERRNDILTETLEKSEYEYAREVALIQSEHERMLAVVSREHLV